jgi:hypothetical protein
LPVFSSLQDILRDAAKHVLQHEEQQKYIFSVTEEEVMNGLLHNPNRDTQSLCILRDIAHIEEFGDNDVKKNYIDMLFDKEKGGMVIDADAKVLLEKEKENVVKSFRDPEASVFRVVVDNDQVNMGIPGVDIETPAGIAYRRSLCDKVCNSLSSSILNQVEQKMWAPPPVYDEIVQHLTFQEEKLKTYVDRNDVQDVIAKYLTSTIATYPEPQQPPQAQHQPVQQKQQQQQQPNQQQNQNPKPQPPQKQQNQKQPPQQQQKQAKQPKQQKQQYQKGKGNPRGGGGGDEGETTVVKPMLPTFVLQARSGGKPTPAPLLHVCVHSRVYAYLPSI